MKKSLAKLLALTLAGVMSVSVIGCGGKTEKTETAPTPTTAPAAQTSNETKTPESTPTPVPDLVYVPEAYDCKGVTLKVFGSEWNNIENTENIKYSEAKNYIEKKYNVKLVKAEMAGYDGYNDDDLLIASIAAGDPAADIITLNPESFYACYENDILCDLTGFYKNLKIGSLYTDVATWKGHVYGVSYDNIGDSWVIVYDRNYVKNLGIETPTEKFMKGQWSYKDFEAYCAEMKAKLPEGVYPAGFYPYHWLQMTAGANGVAMLDSKGNVNLTDPAIIESLEFYQKLENEKLVFPMWLTRGEDGKVTDSAVAYALDDPSIVMKRVEAWQLGGITYDYGICYWPWGSNVTCSGDYTTLSDNYKVSVCYWGVDAAVKASAEKYNIPANVLTDIIYDYRSKVSDNGIDWMHDAYLNEKAGNFTSVGAEYGQERNFFSEEDIELYDWGHTRALPDYAWMLDSAWLLPQKTLIEYTDVRSSAESYLQEALAQLDTAAGRETK